MIKRLTGAVATRSRAVIHDGLVFTVATAANKSGDMFAQTRDALAAIEATLAEAGTSKSRILSATVYIADMARKPEMNRAWDAWVDPSNPPQRACIGVELEADTLVEILVTAAA
ncbi:MAG: RidA family protein [Hyphomicrobiaceae bacterium]|nr:RidA family protein [Hyphomicrobiaceae bacterium]